MRLARLFDIIRLRLRSLFRRDDVERDLDEELRDHVDRQTAYLIAQGLAPENARTAALRSIGGLESRKEECRETWGVRMIQDFAQDLRFAARMLRRSPGFTSVAVAALALGIGANVAVFSVVNGVLLRPLPFPEPERLFVVSLATPSGPFKARTSMADGDYLQFRAATQSFESLAAFSGSSMSLTGAGDPVRIQVANVTGDFFRVLRVDPLAGRVFMTEDESPGRDRVVILGNDLWRSRFGGDEGIVGKDISLNGVRHAVLGVMPAGFSFPNDSVAWTPKLVRLDPHMGMMLPVIGRLKPGTTQRAAQSEFAAFAQHARPQANLADEGRGLIGVFPMKNLLVGDVRDSLKMFSAAVAFVLLIVCANVASLMLTRASVRRRELAVRTALGGRRGRLIRQLLTESLAVSLAGGLCGIVLARWGVQALAALAPKGTLPRMEMVHLDVGALAFGLVVSVMTGIAFGLIPALQVTRRDTRRSLLPGGRSAPGRQERLRAVLVVTEIALALILLTGAGLLTKSFLRLRAVDPGFQPENIATLTVDLPDARYRTPADLRRFHADMLAKLAALPDVTSAGAVNWRPFGNVLIRGDVHLDNGMKVPRGFLPDKPAVSPEYFRTMGIRLRAGRSFTDFDAETSPGVAIVSQRAALTLWPGREAVGRRITLVDNPKPEDWLDVVGVVDDVAQSGFADGPHPAVYAPLLQVKQPFFLSHMTFVVRTTSSPMALAPAIRTVVRQVDRDLPVPAISAMPDVMAATIAEPRFHARLIGVFAAMALLVALIGTYGVLGCTVAQRAHEIGLRMALGAERRDVIWMVLRRTLALAATGVAIGVVGAVALTRLWTKFLFDVTPTDPWTFGLVALLLGATALAAGVIPARRASRVDPLVVLRCD